MYEFYIVKKELLYGVFLEESTILGRTFFMLSYIDITKHEYDMI
jgi:hypothetical protein